MKRIILTIMMVATSVIAFSQPQTRWVCVSPAYPLVVGTAATENTSIVNNGIYVQDVLLDSLPQYEIGEIPNQTVRWTENGSGFYVKADTLHSDNVVYSYTIDRQPIGPIEFNDNTGRFKFYPDIYDYKPFVVTFVASDGIESIEEKVEFSIMPPAKSEAYVMPEQGTAPQDDIYTIVAESKAQDKRFFNNQERDVYSYSVTGTDVIFDDNVHNKVYGLNGREDIYELNLFAERLIVRSALKFPQTNVTIHAKEIIFEDSAGGISSINTTPSSIATMTTGVGINGSNAGNINLYVDNFVGDLAKRLILNGAKGQSSNRNGSPGNGGNGGVINTNIDIRDYCEFTRGSSGIMFGANSQNPESVGDIIGAGQIGQNGSFELNDNSYLYIHPLYISSVLRQTNDAYINGKNNYTLQVCNEYKDVIEQYLQSPEWSACDEECAIALQNNLDEINDLIERLNRGLDYFGNPIGWVPLLSFEVMLNVYDDEIERAIPTLYLNYWLSKIDQTLAHKVEASQTQANITLQEIENCQTLINQMVSKIPVIEDQAADVQHDLDAVNQKISLIEKRLLKKARKNIKKRNRIKKAVGICKTIANVLPITGPVGTTISTTVNSVLSNDIFGSLMGYLGIDYASAVSAVGDVACNSSFLSDLMGNLDDLKAAAFDMDFDSLKSGCDSLKNICNPLIKNIKNLSALLSKGSAPKSEVDKLFQDLCSECPEWKALKAEMDSLKRKQEDLRKSIEEMTASVSSLLIDVKDDILALDALKRDVFKGNSVRDLNAMQYLAKMEQKAKSRLEKYHYYLRKAYEYRLLRPYSGEFNLVAMFERFEKQGNALGDNINPNQYGSLAAVFKEVISDMTAQIIDEYSTNYPEQSAPITFVIPKDQIALLNLSGGLTFNFHEMGLFSPEEENIRIVDLGVKYIKSHVDGNVGYSGYMDLNMTHEGISQLRKDGQLYWFDHKSKSTTSPHTWGMRYDVVSQETTTIQPSAASQSLLYSILGDNHDIMLFSRPSAWGDINLSKKIYTSGGADIVVDSLVMKLQYDFNRRPDKLCNIDIATRGDLLPYIACNAPDQNGRAEGNGNLYRSYIKSAQPVTFSAVEKYGNYYFVNWTDRGGKVVSDKADLTVTRSTDQFYFANYEWRAPILGVADTIKVDRNGGMKVVEIKNVGNGGADMDWSVDDSECKWLRVDGSSEGINDGTFTIKIDANDTGKIRIDSLEVLAPETDFMSKMIYVLQSDDSSVERVIDYNDNGITVYPNPTTDIVYVAGSLIDEVRVISLTGGQISTSCFNGENKVSVDLSGLPTGAYMLLVKTRTGNSMAKVLKR